MNKLTSNGIVPGSVTISGSVVGGLTDDGRGNLVDAAGDSLGTVVYATGVINTLGVANVDAITSTGAYVRHFPDLGYSVVAEPHGHHVSFNVHEIVGVEENGTVLWQRAGSAFNREYATSIDEAQIFLHGDVKWDGCSNWHFDEQDRVMLHGCSREDLTNMGAVMGQCWDWAKELLPNFLD